MENSLDNQFDQFIKGSLEDLQAPYDSSTWDALEHKLDQAMAPDIDSVARLAMVDLAVPYNPASWNALEQKMDQVTAQEVDTAAKQAISNLTVPYNAATWQVLSDRLDRIDYRRKLIALKLVEAALILLALITAVRFIQQVPSKQKSQVVEQQLVILSDDHQSDIADEAAAKDLNAATHQAATNEAIGVNNQELSEVKEVTGLAKDRSAVSGHADADALASHEPVASSQIKSRRIHTASVLEKRALQLDGKHPEISANPWLGDADWLRITAPLANLSGKDLEVRTPKSRLTRAQMKEALIGIPTLNVRTIMHEDMPISLASAAPKLRKVKSLTTRLGVYRQVSDHVVTQQFGRGVVKSQTKKNGAVGVMTSVQSGKLGFDFGLAYEKLMVDGESFTSEGPIFENELHLVQLPLNIRVVPISNRYFDIYFKGGGTAHGAIYALYEEPYATARGATPLGYNEKFNGGLLNDEGNWRKQNMYYTINYGVGVEIKAFEKWSIFAEGMLQDYHSGTLGLKDMRIKSRSYNLGINRTL